MILIFQGTWSFKMMKGSKMETFSSKLIDDLLDSIDPVEQAKTDAKMIIAAKIADSMKARGWRKTDLLKAMNRESPSIITKWLSGTHNFTIDTLVELGHALDIHLLNIAEPEEKVVIYFQSVQQESPTSSNDNFMNDLLNNLERDVPSKSVKSIPAAFNSYKVYAQA